MSTADETATVSGPQWYCPGCGTRYFGPGICANMHPALELAHDDTMGVPAPTSEPPAPAVPAAEPGAAEQTEPALPEQASPDTIPSETPAPSPSVEEAPAIQEPEAAPAPVAPEPAPEPAAVAAPPTPDSPSMLLHTAASLLTRAGEAITRAAEQLGL